MDGALEASAEEARRAIEAGAHDSSKFRAALASVPPRDRDAWVDAVLGLGEMPDDEALPRGCVPYLPCAVDVVLRMIDEARVNASDVFVDIGSGLGRASVLVQLLTDAPSFGLEIQPSLAKRSCVPCMEGDATELTHYFTTASVFFLYCPFGGARLEKVLSELEALARNKELRICCVDLPLPARDWLVREPSCAGDLSIYRTTLHV